MELWHPRANRNPWTDDGGSFIGVPWKQVLHTTEAKNFYPSSLYYGHTMWPHVTIARVGGKPAAIYQHGPINRAAKAMKNLAGGVQTNRANAIQCEIAWVAKEGDNLPTDYIGALADWISWVSEQTGSPLEALDFHPYPPPMRLGTEPWRLRGDDWYAFTGICGHQHVDENVHGDPGDIPIGEILIRAKGEAAPDSPLRGVFVHLSADEEREMLNRLRAIEGQFAQVNGLAVPKENTYGWSIQGMNHTINNPAGALHQILADMANPEIELDPAMVADVFAKALPKELAAQFAHELALRISNG